MKALVAVATAALVLVLAPAAGAWTKLSDDRLANIVDPSVLRTRAGSELIAFDSPTAGTISLVRNGGAPRTLVPGDPAAGEPQLVQQPSGTIQLYFPDAQGVGRLTSTDDGQSWTGPIQTASHDVSGVRSAAVRADGTPLFSQDGTGFVNVFQGLNGESVGNVFPRCCGYAETLAVDSTGLIQLAFWSNATPPNDGYLYLPLGGGLANLSGGGQTVSNDSRVPLVADRAGNTFGAWIAGYPTATALRVQTFRGGSAVRSVRLFGGDVRKAALAVEPDGKLWAVWIADGAVHAARSRSAGAHFGVQVHANLPAGATAYQLEALGGPDAVTAVANFGSALFAQKLLPGLAVSLKKTGKTWAATVVDDGFAVAGATVTGGGRTLHAGASGRVSLAGLRHHTFMRAAHAGYVGTGFRVP